MDDDNDGDGDDDKSPEKMKTQSYRKYVVASPRCPSGLWMDFISNRRIGLVSSAGSRVFILEMDEVISESMAKLYRKAVFGVSNPQAYPRGSSTISDDASLDSGVYSQDSSNYIFEVRGRVDCMLLASGKVLLSHRALLAQRSPVLRDLIYEEYSGTISEITHILLPDLHTDTAKAFLYFIYTDVLPGQCNGNITLLRNLSRCGRSFKIPRLSLLCDNALKALTSHDKITTGRNNQSNGINNTYTHITIKPSLTFGTL
jgi:hypothetical protein